MPSHSKSILVIGSGVIGLCSAYYLVRKGHQVTVLDRVSPNHQGCSYGNAGMIVPSHFIPLAAPGMVKLALKWMWNPESPFYLKPRFDLDLFHWGWNFFRAANPRHVNAAAPLLRDLHSLSREAFVELAEAFQNDFSLTQKGLLMLCKTGHALEEEAAMARQAHQLGIPAEVLDPKKTAALDPNVRMEIAGSVYFPKDCHLAPAQFMESLRRRLDQCGVKFSWQTDVTGWRLDRDRVQSAQTTRGEFTADEFLLAGGSWSPQITGPLQLKLPMQAGKGYSLTLQNPRQLPQICSIFTEARIAVTPINGALRFGGTMEIAGLNEQINPARIRGIIKAVPNYYPDFHPEDFAGIQPWCGLRPCSPDGLPYLGRTRRFPNLCIATGHAMMGLSLGPVTGQIAAELVSGEKPSVKLDLLDPERFN